MYKIGLLICFSQLFFSCSKDPVIINDTSIIGVYSGTFARNGFTSNVEINVTRSGLTGTSEVHYFPAICAATYTSPSAQYTTGSTIIFENTCFWPANFDWSLILNGTWHIQWVHEVLYLTNSDGDLYILTKKQ
jgi:hypothetical protein